jgi:hypothetical protein
MGGVTSGGGVAAFPALGHRIGEWLARMVL